MSIFLKISCSFNRVQNTLRGFSSISAMIMAINDSLRVNKSILVKTQIVPLTFKIHLVIVLGIRITSFGPLALEVKQGVFFAVRKKFRIKKIGIFDS